jgi:tripeptide aminopeptidase
VLGDDGIIRSQGNTILASDDKSGIAAIFEALRSLIETGESLPTVFVLLSTCEELSLLGSGAFDVNALPQGAPLYVFDADGAPGTIITKAPSHYTFEACFTGKSAHAGVEPEAGISAIRMAANAIANMPLGRLDECTTANVGLIDGGREVNIVPETCTIKGECRSFYEERLVPVRAALEDACVQAAAQAGGSVNVSWRVDYKAVLYKEDHPVVQAVVRAAERAGLTPRIAQSGGGADANKYASQGIPAITLGTGMTNFHTTQEHIALADLEGLTRLIEELLRDPLEVVQ